MVGTRSFRNILSMSLLLAAGLAGLAGGCSGGDSAPSEPGNDADGGAQVERDASVPDGPSWSDADTDSGSGGDGGTSGPDAGAPDSGGADSGGADSGTDEPRRSELGVNYNGRTRNYRQSDVARTGTTWVRAFIDVTKLERAGTEAIQTHPDLVGFRKMHDDGYKVVLNLKYDYRSDEQEERDFPSDANSKAFKDIRAFTTQLLNSVYPETDMIVVGNEPFIESDIADRDDDLVLFQKHMANHVITYNKAHGNIPLYVGAFNNLHKPTWRTQAAKDLITYARNTPGVTGIDLHLHAASIDEMRQAILWAKNQLGAGKRLISTEFSLIQYFRKHLEKPIPKSFATQYALDETWQVHQYLDYALKTGRPRQEWLDFLEASPWFMQVHESLTDADSAFDELGLTVATYAMEQTQASLGPDSDPWLLNGLYCSRTCEPNPTTLEPQFGYWIESFKARQ